MYNFPNFFLEKVDLFGKKNVALFENSIKFLILCILEKKLRNRPGAFAPHPDPLRGRVIAFKWMGRPPPPKKSWRRLCLQEDPEVFPRGIINGSETSF